MIASSFETTALSPYLEYSGSGSTSLWARAKAMKYKTNVLAGYPEKTDPAKNCPPSTESYNSAIMVNSKGEDVLHYRRQFVGGVGGTGAFQGEDFSEKEISGLGKVCVALGQDLNHG